MKGELPCQGINANSDDERYRAIANIKIKTKPQVLCSGLAEEFNIYINNVRSFEFEAEPKYQYLSELFTISKVWSKK